ncbi:Penicillin amidase family protein [Erythrobacter dokdonensis DSW-74]|uniref:Penicillin amidase family protein n=1 Tax=Erythrobacter dokdonensis DSW-74 TaxID=1300349 RepID=A0A1A7BF70_9SPHN|nr:Penicillin amidase family protein [Erythrobacter dokdonensis DSW-74]
MKRGGIALVAVGCLAFTVLATWEPFFASAANPPAGRVYSAEIIRDDFGVPHIYGKTDADAAFGVAVAHAEDDFFTLQDVVAMARGRYGAIAGEDGAKIDYVYHLIDARGTAEANYPKLPEDTRALFEAYAAGLNHYAQQRPDEVKLANLFPVAGIDVAAGFALRQPFFFGLDSVIGPLVAGEDLRREHGPDIPGFPREQLPGSVPEKQSAPAQASRTLVLPLGEDAEHMGSNAFAVAPEKGGGTTTLISNSHQPLRGGVAWYELVVESEEGWHFAGANFPGSPFPFLGHNEHLGWTNTVNTPDMIDVYQLELDETGTRYKLDGEWRDLESAWVTLPVKLGPVVLPIRREVLRSVHGPVIRNDKGAFAVRYGGIGRLEQLDAYYRLNKATSFAEWEAQISRLAIPSTNFIYADQDGTIAYVYNAALPNRPEGVEANWRSVLPGDRSDLVWQGAVDYEALPRIVNPASGWLYNSNNTPFTAAGAGSDLDPDAFSPVMGIELKQTNRSRRAYQLLTEAGVLDRAALERIKYDTGYAREGYVARLFDALDTVDVIPAEAKEFGEAVELLRTWDFTADGQGRADALALLVIRDFMSADYGNRPFPDVREKVQAAADHLVTHFGRLDPPMAELLRLRQGDLDLPLDGGSDTLRASTTWDVDDDGRLSLKHGDSFIQWVEWQKGKRVFSRSIQPFGSATTRPESPHYTDQMQLFVEHKLKPVHFWRDDVMANAIKRTNVTNAS